LAGLTIPDPATIEAELRSAATCRAEYQREWERLDTATNPRAVLRQPELARLMLAEDDAVTRLTAELKDARLRREAFLRAAERFDAIVREEEQLLASALNRPSPDDATRAAQLSKLGEVSRLRSRLGWALRQVSSHRNFRERRSGLEILALELTARQNEAERARGFPGDKPRFTMPEDVGVLISALQGGAAAQKETTHAVR